MYTIKKEIALATQGLKKNRLFVRDDYKRYVSTAEELNAVSWYKTGTQLRKAMDKVGAKYAKQN